MYYPISYDWDVEENVYKLKDLSFLKNNKFFYFFLQNCCLMLKQQDQKLESFFSKSLTFSWILLKHQMIELKRYEFFFWTGFVMQLIKYDFVVGS